jgi:tape measure domain-containing protein
MARYSIDFSTNANTIIRSIEGLNKEIADVAKTGKNIEINLDTSKLQQGINTTFKQLDKEIAKYERQLRKLQIGSPEFAGKAREIGEKQGLRERGRLQAQSAGLREQAFAFEGGSAIAMGKLLQSMKIDAAQIKPNTQEWAILQQRIASISIELKKADALAENIQLTKELGALAPGSLQALETRLTILRSRAREISPDTTEWKELNKEIVKAEQGVDRQTRRPLTRGQRMGAAGGAFLYGGGLGGGVGSAVGGIAGGLIGGVPGAFTGAAVGQTVDNVAAMGAGAAKSAADIAQLQRGLALASIDANDFAAAQQAIAQSSDTLSIPLEQVYRQFTQLRVNTKEYGMSIKETQEILEGVTLAVSSVGGSMEDVDGAMRAVVQIFSKGKVQAEELRGQLGERFPGAVVKFAQANKMSFEELQVALEEGKVTVGDFVEFAKKNYQDFAKFSEQIATAPEFAGRRLEKAMSDMQIAIGTALGPAGAAFQDFATEAIKSITDFVTKNRGLIIQVGQDFSAVFSGIVSAASMMGQMIMKVLGPVYQYIAQVINQLRVMTGTATASGARAEMDASFALMKKHGPGRTRFQQGSIGYMSDKIEYDKAAARYAAAEKEFKATGGSAAMASLTTPQNLTFGGPGAGINLNAISGDDGKKKKGDKLDIFNNSQLDFIQQRFDAEKLVLNQQMQANLLSQTSYDIKLAELTLETKKAELQERFRLESEKIKTDNLSAADKALALGQQELFLQNALVQAEKKRDITIKGAKLELRKPFVDALRSENMEIDKQEALLVNLRKGIAELTPEQEANFLIEEKIAQLKADEQKIIETDINNLREQIKLRIENGILLEKENGLFEAQRGLRGIGDGLRAGFTGSAASVFERAMEQYDDVDYATKLANIETSAMQLRSVFEGLQGAISGVSNAFASMLTQGITNMITGTATAKEVFASFLQGVGQALSQAAAQMIATYIAIGLAKIFAGLGGGGAKTDKVTNFNAGVAQYTYANGGIAPGGFRAFANGGVVNGPTLGLVGEGKYNEAIVPLPDGKSIPVQLGGGSSRDLLGGGARQQASSPVLSMSFQSTTINGVEYVDRAQLESAMAETRRLASRDGASRGSQLALSKLKNSPNTRRQLGLG